MENKLTEKEIITILEKTLIEQLIKESIKQDNIQEYRDKIDIHYQIQKHPYYNIKYLKKIDQTYINIKAETILKEKKQAP